MAGVARHDDGGEERYDVLLRTEWDSYLLNFRADGGEPPLKSLRFKGVGFIGRTKDGVVTAGGDYDEKVIWVSRDDRMRRYPVPDTPFVMGGCPTPDGGLTLVGRLGQTTAFVLKIGASGALEWAKTFEVSGAEAKLATIAPHPAGGYVAGGYSQDGAWVLRLAADGSIQWQNCYRIGGGMMFDVLATRDGGAFAVGRQRQGNDVYRMWIVKLDGAGKVQWARQTNGTHEDEAYDAVETESGYRVFGITSSFGVGVANFIVLDVSRDGRLISQQVHGLPDDYLTVYKDSPSFALPTASGGVIMAASQEDGSLRVTRLEENGATPKECAFLAEGTAALQPVEPQVIPSHVEAASVEISASEPEEAHWVYRRASLAPLCGLDARAKFEASLKNRPKAERDPDLLLLRKAAKLEADEKALREQVVDLFERKRFADLDALGERFIAKRERFTPMLWKIETFHAALDEDAYLRNREQHLAIAEEWAQHSPQSAVAQTALGAALVSRAWEARGGGYDVTAKGGAGYDRYMKRAEDEMAKRERVASNDPEYFAVLARISAGADWPQLVAKAGAAANYAHLYFAIANYLLPQWGGTDEEYARFMSAAAEHTRAELGDAMYAALTMFHMQRADSDISGSRFDEWGWERLEKAFADWFARIPEAITARHAEMYIAHQTGNAERAMELFAQPELAWSHFAQPIWNSHETYDQLRGMTKERAAKQAARRAAAMPPPLPPAPKIAPEDVVLIVDAELPDGTHHRDLGFLVRTADGVFVMTAGEKQEVRKITLASRRKPNETWVVERAQLRRNGNVLIAKLEAGRLAKVRPLLEWKLDVFYEGLSGSGHLGDLEAWMKARPKSTAARVALAEAYMAAAWNARGAGYANTVTNQAGQKFEEMRDRAEKLLRDSEAIASKDPRYYTILIDANMGEDALAIAERGNRIAPYSDTWEKAIVYSRPQWGGSPADYHAIASRAADATKAEIGDSLYAWAAGFTFASQPPTDAAFRQYGFSWPRVRQGMRDRIRLDPAPRRLQHELARMAIVAKDMTTARELFAQPALAWSPTFANIWGGKSEYDRARASAITAPAALPQSH